MKFSKILIVLLFLRNLLIKNKYYASKQLKNTLLIYSQFAANR